MFTEKIVSSKIVGISQLSDVLERIGTTHKHSEKTKKYAVGSYVLAPPFRRGAKAYVSKTYSQNEKLHVLGLAAGIVGTVNIAFLTSLVSKKYTAFQYALLTGFMTLPGFALKGLSGVWVESFQIFYGFEYGWMSFYIATSLLTIPSILLLYFNRAFMQKHEDTL